MKAYTQSLQLLPVDNTRLQHLCGSLDAHLRQIEIALGVSIARRAEVLRITADEQAHVEQAFSVLRQLYAQANRALQLEDVQLALVESKHVLPVTGTGLRTRRGELRARTPRQQAYINHIQQHDITFGIGPAGTGKTYLAVASAVDALEREAVKRVILVRPAVEAGEHLGFLPGDLTQKVDPYLRPLYDALYDLMGFDKVTRLFEHGYIEIAPLAYMRGRTLNHAFIILDEAQNTTPEQMKMFLTRIGFGSKAVITGDVTQIDLAHHQKSGLVEASRILSTVQGIAFLHFQAEDVVRHPLVQQIINAYARDQETQQRGH